MTDAKAMCGINGFTFQDSAALRRMHASTHHRGPDDEGFFETPEVSLAQNRLSIIDLSPGGHQPMSTADGRYTITFNGEIYNYQELKQELIGLGRSFQSASDTEVLLQGFAQWGTDVLRKLNGIFAFAIWDRDQKELVLARDRFGVKPLYCHWSKNRLVFSSELKGILAHGIAKEIDLDAVNLFFRFLYVPGPRTMFQNIRSVMPGELLRVRGGDIESERWWKLEEGEMLTDREEAQHQIRTLAQDAVRLQLVSDRPLGVFLSGGIDSSAILGLMRNIVTGPIKTFSVGYEATAEAEKYNADFLIAARTAKYFNVEHHPIVISGKDVAGCFEDIAWHMDNPVSNHIQPSTYLLAKYAKPEITVALGGDGADELFGGYDRYWLWSALNRLQALPAWLRSKAMLSFVARVTGKVSLLDKAGLPPGLDRFLSFMAQKETRMAEFLKPVVNRPRAGVDAFAPYFATTWKDNVNQMMATDVQTWLVDESLVRSDKLTMAHGLEERVPLLDMRLADLAFRIPSSWKLDKRSLGKKILRDALADVIPPFVIREKKRGFFSPASKWLRGDLLPLAKEILSPGYAPGCNDFFDFDAIDRMLKDHVTKQRYGLNQLWALMTFRAWWRKMM